MITHPDKVLFPDAGITKGELASYYESIAPLILPHIRARPLTMENRTPFVRLRSCSATCSTSWDFRAG